MLVVPAEVGGRATSILIEAGTPVEPNTVIFELSNPELQLNWLDAQSQLNSAKAKRNAQTASLYDQLLGMEAGLAQTQANLNAAKLRFEVDKKQYDDGLISELQMTLSKSSVAELEKLLEIQTKRYDVFLDQTKPAQLLELDALVEQAQSLYNLRKAQVESLKVRAGVTGVLAPVKVPIELGQQVSAGQILARITNPSRLKARLQIPQSQARDVRIGLPAEIDTYNGLVSGCVSRIEPTVMEGNVTVDVSLNGELPKGARFAVRVPVQFGKTSVSTIEVLNGLVIGDEVILSDVSQWDMKDKIRLK
jgi:HlyD family secretion protein